MTRPALPRATANEPADASLDRPVTAKVIPLKALKRRLHRPDALAAALGSDLPTLGTRHPKRPKERATPGVPGLKQVESLADPRAWNWVYRCTDPTTGKRTAISYGSSTEVSYMEAVSRAQHDRERVRRGLSPKGSDITHDAFVETVVKSWAQENLRSWRDLLSRYALYFAEPLGAMPIRSVSAFEVEQALDALRQQQAPGASRRRARLKVSTINRAAMALRTIYRLAKQRGVIDHNPLDGWSPHRESPPPPLALGLDEIERLLKRLQAEPEPFRLLVELILETGMRVGEALHARFTHVDAPRRLLNLIESKGGGNEIVPLTARAMTIVERLRVLSRNDWLFPAAYGDGPMSAPRKRLKRVFADVGVDPSACFHTLRKSTATLAATHGVDILTVSRLLRHRSIRTTERHYLATQQDSLFQAVDVVSGLLQGAAA